MKNVLHAVRIKEIVFWILAISCMFFLGATGFAQEKPGPTNTGYTGTLTSQGVGTITVDGTIIENVSTGPIVIRANNVTIRNCRIDGGNTASYGIECKLEDYTGLVVEDCEILNIKSAGIYGRNFTARRLNIHESDGDGIKPVSDCLIEYCWIHHLGRGEGAHADGIQSRGNGSNFLVRYNNFDMPVTVPAPYKSNSNFMLQQEEGPLTNYVIENNWLNGGNYTVYGSYIAIVRNNFFGRDNRYGIMYHVTDHECNTWEDTGEPIDECGSMPLVSTPSIDPASGTFSDPVPVTISCSTSGAEIYYTVDGSDPSQSSTLYTGSFTVSTTTTVKARGYATDMTASYTASASIVILNAENIALGKTVTQSDYQNEDPDIWPGSYLVDGDVSDASRWSASGYPQWAIIDLGSNNDISGIHVYTYAGRAYQYLVEASTDGSSYSTIVDRTSNTDNAQPIVDNVTTNARYIKITVTGASGYTGTWVSINEVMVMGETGDPVPPTSISVSPTSLNLNINETSDLTETVLPVNATDKSVTWNTSNPAVATVSGSGLVTAVAEGNATITVTTNTGGYTANCEVIVGSAGSSTETTLNPVVDAYVRGGNYADNNYGTDNIIYVKKHSSGDYTREGYLKFDLSGVSAPVTSATLRLYVTSTDGASTHSVKLVSDDTWTEAGITYNNKPVAGNEIASSAVSATGYIEIDIQSAVEAEAGDLLSLQITSDNDSYIGYDSREGTNMPELIIVSEGGQEPINNSPTINAISDVTILSNAGEQTVNLSGISDGDGNTQTVSISALSSNTNVAGNVQVSYVSGDATGTLTFDPVSPGTATITLTVTDDGGTANGGIDTKVIAFDVVVNPVVPTSISLDQTSISLEEGLTAQLTATVLPVDADDKSVIWSTSNESIATVSNGLVTAVAEGAATITATTIVGGLVADCEVTVTTLPTEVTLNPVADAYVRGGDYAANNYGTATTIYVKNYAAINYTREGYLKFDLSGISTVSSATLRLYVSSTDGASTHSFKLVSDDSWTETGITYNNKPAAGSEIASYAISATGYIEIDIQSAVEAEAGGMLSLQITADNGTYIGYDSREGTNKPELIINSSNKNATISLNNVIKTNDAFINAYPNPCNNNYFTINISGINSENTTTIQLFDMTGKLAYSNQINGENAIRINTDKFENGIYILNVTSRTNSYQEKIIIR